MDRAQEEMQFLGLFGIYKESFKLIFKLRKIFSQITLTLILPLSFIFLAQEDVSEILNDKISFNEFVLSDTKKGTPQYHKLSDVVSSEWAAYILVKIFYFAFVLAFSLLSTSAVVYTIACVYTSREITFRKIMSVVPRVWKRLIITFLCAFFAFCAYIVVFGFTLCMWGKSGRADSKFGVAVFVIVVILYALGFVYMAVIWQLASVVSVLEDLHGFKAMIKSRKLIQGKLFVGIAIFVKLIVFLVITNFGFKVFVMYRVWGRMEGLQVIGFGVIFLLLLLNGILFGLVVQTVIYFVCKSYHHQIIDKSALSDHLEVICLGDYVPLKANKDVQLEEYHV
ncbi:hypothetical protein DH2020_007898 [Rehmannia glutinosa]|uniref:Uncharacterized protein n=1 Tax=Rehmannia glutinosa TaxID=99300 RepID=A0ABR0TZH7_REHGL